MSINSLTNYSPFQEIRYPFCARSISEIVSLPFLSVKTEYFDGYVWNPHNQIQFARPFHDQRIPYSFGCFCDFHYIYYSFLKSRGYRNVHLTSYFLSRRDVFWSAAGSRNAFLFPKSGIRGVYVVCLLELLDRNWYDSCSASYRKAKEAVPHLSSTQRICHFNCHDGRDLWLLSEDKRNNWVRFNAYFFPFNY